MTEKVNTVIECYFLLPDFLFRGHPIYVPVHTLSRSTNTILKTKIRRLDILERILDTEKTTFELKPGKSIQREELDAATSLHNKPSWVRAFEK